MCAECGSGNSSSLRDMIGDPVIQSVMAADGVCPVYLATLIETVARRRCERTMPAIGAMNDNVAPTLRAPRQAAKPSDLLLYVVGVDMASCGGFDA